MLSLELRASYNIGGAMGTDCWGPVLNLARDPRWGRNGEAGSEDPYLMGQYAIAATAGFQNGSAIAPAYPGLPFYRGVVTLKHWAANTLEDSDGYTRHTFDANVSNFILQDACVGASSGRPRSPEIPVAGFDGRPLVFALALQVLPRIPSSDKGVECTRVDVLV